MIIKAQNGKFYDIYIVSVKGKCVVARDNFDRRKSRMLGHYPSEEKANSVLKEIHNCVDGYFEMPLEILNGEERENELLD